MGKNLIQQARGKGSSTYRAHSFRFHGDVIHKKFEGFNQPQIQGIVLSFEKCPGHSTPLAKIKYSDGEICLMLAPEGLKVGDMINCNATEVALGNTLFLKDIPEGTLINNIESNPGDGGKFCRASGTCAKVLAKQPAGILVLLPSKKKRIFHSMCRASLGILAGGGREEKPLLKAGNAYYKMRAKNKLYPLVGGLKMNAVDHPYGKSRSSKKGKPTIAPKNAPPGRNVGKIHPRRTGIKR